MIFLDYDPNSQKGFLKIQGEVSGECPSFPKEMTELQVEVNSWGGDFFLGLELYRNIKKLACRKTARVETAMSAATMPVCACQSIVLQPDSLFMIHGVTAVGIDCNQQEALRLAGELGAMNKQLAGIYSSACSKNEAEILSMIERETYLSPAELRDFGFPVIIENLKNKKSKKKNKSYDNEVYFSACQTFMNSLIRRLNMDEKKEEEKKVEEECKTEGEVTPEEAAPEEKSELTEDRVREICREVFEQLFANLKAESEEEKPEEVEEEKPSEEKKEEESTEEKVAQAVKAERVRIAALNSYASLTDSAFLSTAVESGMSESEFAIEVLRQQKLANEKRRQTIASAVPLAPVQNYTEPTKTEQKADPKHLMNLIFG